MIEVIRLVREDHCPNCRTDRALECYNNKDEPVQFSLHLDRRQQGKPVEFRFKGYVMNMKCKCCKSKFMIDWTGDYPRPLSHQAQYNLFMKNYSVD